MIAIDNIFVDVNGITKLNSEQKFSDPNNASVLTIFPITVSAGLGSPSSEGAKSKLNWYCQNAFKNALVGKMKSTCLIYVGTKLRLENISHISMQKKFCLTSFQNWASHKCWCLETDDVQNHQMLELHDFSCFFWF